VAVENSELLELSLADMLSFFELYPRLFCNFMRVAELQMEEACLNMSIQVCLASEHLFVPWLPPISSSPSS
jgi:hypothetical protein